MIDEKQLLEWESLLDKSLLQAAKSMVKESHQEPEKTRYGYHTASVCYMKIRESNGRSFLRMGFEIKEGNDAGKFVYTNYGLQYEWQISSCLSMLKLMFPGVDFDFSNIKNFSSTLDTNFLSVKNKKIFRIYFHANSKGYESISVIERL